MSLVMQQSKIPLSVFTTGTGHESISSAVVDCLTSNGYLAHHNFVSMKMSKFYGSFYLFFPQLFKLPYNFGEIKRIQGTIRRYLGKSIDKEIKEALNKQMPQAVISCWFLANYLIEKEQKRHGYTFVNIVSDPKTIHSIIPSHKGLNFVFDNKAKQLLEAQGIPSDKIVVSGWFVRAAYEQAYDQSRVQKHLGLNPNNLTLLLSSGSFGTNYVLKVLPTILTANKPCTIIVACGHNKRLYSLINQTAKLRQKINHTPVEIKPIGYTTKLHEYMQAADLVIGKAGPNTLFESIATSTPFFAITHIAGQEDGNLDIIKEYNVGYVEENPFAAGKLLKHIIENPKELESFTKPIAKLRAHNLQAKPLLLATLKQLE
jgi:UDP-N-acetylglucosamine:LPS N-acetylglucosamine transferase